jgi:predicted membrane protein
MSAVTSTRASILAKDGGQFGWFAKIGATPEAVNVLNDQPVLFTILIVVLLAVILQCLLIWYIHFATMKPEQKKKEPKKEAAKPPAKRLPFLRA